MRPKHMNSYSFGFLIEPTTPPVIGDAAGLERLCKQLGYLYYSPGGRLTVNNRITIAAGAYVPTNAAAGNGAVELTFESRYQLPSSLMPPVIGATTSGEVLASAGGGIFAARTVSDDKCTTLLTGLDKPTVSKGAGIVAYVPAGTDISDELDAQLTIPVCNGQQLIFGRAIQDAMQGIYDTPFSSAWAFAIMGGRNLNPVVVVGGNVQTYRRQ